MKTTTIIHYSFFTFLFSFFSLFAQTDIELRLTNGIPLKADCFLGADIFGYIYYVKDNVLIKQKESEIRTYKNISLGKIKTVDIENPMNILLFYSDFNTVVILDNQLSETQKINLSSLQKPIMAKYVGMTSLNKIWIYDSLAQQLALYDFLSKDYRVISIQFADSLSYFQSSLNVSNIITSDNNWYYIDLYGKITDNGKLPTFNSIYFYNNNNFLFSQEGNLFSGNSNNIIDNKYTKLQIRKKTFDKFAIKEQNLFIFASDSLKTYKINRQ